MKAGEPISCFGSIWFHFFDVIGQYCYFQTVLLLRSRTVFSPSMYFPSIWQLFHIHLRKRCEECKQSLTPMSDGTLPICVSAQTLQVAQCWGEQELTSLHMRHFSPLYPCTITPLLSVQHRRESFSPNTVINLCSESAKGWSFGPSELSKDCHGHLENGTVYVISCHCFWNRNFWHYSRCPSGKSRSLHTVFICLRFCQQQPFVGSNHIVVGGNPFVNGFSLLYFSWCQ